MGMPKTKADCDNKIASRNSDIAYCKRQLENAKAGLANVKLYKHPNWQNQAAHFQCQIASLKSRIASLQAEIKSLQAQKKSLK